MEGVVRIWIRTYNINTVFNSNAQNQIFAMYSLSLLDVTLALSQVKYLYLGPSILKKYINS
jgi:hypothetical protein